MVYREKCERGPVRKSGRRTTSVKNRASNHRCVEALGKWHPTQQAGGKHPESFAGD